MNEVKVEVTDVDDIVNLHRIMEQTDGCDFDVTSGSIIIDGKSLLGMLGFSRKRFTIKITGNDGNIESFKERISSYIKK